MKLTTNEKIRIALKRSGKTYKDIAQAIGCDVRTIDNRFKGDIGNWKLFELERIATVTDTKVSRLI